MRLRPKYNKQISLPVNIGQTTEAAVTAGSTERARRGGSRGVGDVRVVSIGIPVQVSHSGSPLKSAEARRKYMSVRCVSTVAAGDETRKWTTEKRNDFTHRKSPTTTSTSSSSSSSSTTTTTTSSSLSVAATQVGLRLREIADALDRMYDEEVYFVSEWNSI